MAKISRKGRERKIDEIGGSYLKLLPVALGDKSQGFAHLQRAKL